MIESIYITFIALGTLFLILGLELERITYNAVSILMWIMVLASNAYIEIPSVSTSYTEPAFLMISVAMIIINILIMITGFIENSTQNRINRYARR